MSATTITSVWTRLPSDVLIQIIDETYLLVMLDQNKWRQSLQFLQVCHDWRVALQPRILSTVFIDSGRANGITNVRKVYPGDTQKLLRFRTNLSLIDSLGWQPQAKSLVLRMCAPTGIDFFLDNVLRIMRAASPNWTSIISLKITAVSLKPLPDSDNEDDYEDEYDDDEYGDEDEYGPEGVALALELSDLLPNVVSLSTAVGMDDVRLGPMATKLASVYADRLKRMHYIHPMPARPPQRFEQLVALDVWFMNKHVLQTLRVNSESLLSLQMNGLPDGYMWETFRQETRAIKFPNLTRLSVIHETQLWWGDAHEFSPEQNALVERLEFPRLRSLIVDHCRWSYHLLSYARMPSTLEVLEIRHNMTCISLYNFGFQSAEAKVKALANFLDDTRVG